MLKRGINLFIEPGRYGVVFSKQCDNVASNIMSAGGKGYFVSFTPNLSFNGVSRDWSLAINNIGN